MNKSPDINPYEYQEMDLYTPKKYSARGDMIMNKIAQFQAKHNL